MLDHIAVVVIIVTVGVAAAAVAAAIVWYLISIQIGIRKNSLTHRTGDSEYMRKKAHQRQPAISME